MVKPSCYEQARVPRRKAIFSLLCKVEAILLAVFAFGIIFYFGGLNSGINTTGGLRGESYHMS
jgi:hypothetical protein